MPARTTKHRSHLESPSRVSAWTALAKSAEFKPAQMAEAAGLSLVHLRRLCREVFGITLGEWLRHTRMVAARQLLAETLSTKLTAERLGYSYRTHFARDFQRTYGVSASVWLHSYKAKVGL